MQVHHFVKPRYKKFATEKEALAFIAENGAPLNSNRSQSASSTLHRVTRAGFVTKPQPGTSRIGKLKANSVVPAKKQDDSELWADAKVVYTDGACSANGTAKARAGYGVYWGENHADNVAEPLSGPATNNRAELTAVIRALETAISHKYERLIVCTDSNLLIKTMESYIHGWRKNGWKTAARTDVKNKDLIVRLDELLKMIEVRFEHVAGHAGIFGNERADELARQGATKC